MIESSKWWTASHSTFVLPPIRPSPTSMNNFAKILQPEPSALPRAYTLCATYMDHPWWSCLSSFWYGMVWYWLSAICIVSLVSSWPFVSLPFVCHPYDCDPHHFTLCHSPFHTLFHRNITPHNILHFVPHQIPQYIFHIIFQSLMGALWSLIFIICHSCPRLSALHSDLYAYQFVGKESTIPRAGMKYNLQTDEISSLIISHSLVAEL